jgi:hypothetical protein
MPSRLATAPDAARRRARRTWNGALSRLDGGDGRADAPLPAAPVFVVGAPRSGSTLLYQLMVEAWDVAYLSNLHCAFLGAPHLVERVAGRRRPPSRFASHHGRTKGLAGPSECGDYWYRFFRRRPQYVPLEEADPENMRRLRGSVRALVDRGRPVVFKNLVNSLRVAPLGTALPEALFVVIHRDLVANAASLLAGRLRRSGDYARWWSAEPPGIDRLRGLPAHEQVVEQIREIDALVRADAGLLGPERFHDLTYEGVCEDTHGALEGIREFAAGHGVELRPRGEVPASFEPRGAPDIDPGLSAELTGYVTATTPAET